MGVDQMRANGTGLDDQEGRVELKGLFLPSNSDSKELSLSQSSVMQNMVLQVFIQVLLK